MSWYASEESCPVPGFSYPDGTPATLFRSYRAETVLRHFRWMQRYGIHEALVQTFLVELSRPSTDVVLHYVQGAAAQTGRVFAVGSDVTSMPAERLVPTLQRDGTRLVDRWQLAKAPSYLYHDNRPVLLVWGFFPDRFPPSVDHQLVDWL